MVQLPLRRKPIALVCAAGSLLACEPLLTAEAPETVPVVVVTGSRIERDSFDFPAANDSSTPGASGLPSCA